MNELTENDTDKTKDAFVRVFYLRDKDLGCVSEWFRVHEHPDVFFQDWASDRLCVIKFASSQKARMFDLFADLMGIPIKDSVEEYNHMVMRSYLWPRTNRSGLE